MLFYNYKDTAAVGWIFNEGWEDSTYGNDACPSATKSHYLADGIQVSLKLFLDFPDIEDREDRVADRFALVLYAGNIGDYINEIAHDDDLSIIIQTLDHGIYDEKIAKSVYEYNLTVDKVTELGELL